jgi:hypothetical protein
MARDVSNCEILCYDPVVIPMMALLQPRRYFLTKEAVWSHLVNGASPVFFSFQFSPTPGIPVPL